MEVLLQLYISYHGDVISGIDGGTTVLRLELKYLANIKTVNTFALKNYITPLKAAKKGDNGQFA